MSTASSVSLTLDEAALAHLSWKTRFQVAILKQEWLDHDEISRDDCCTLGKWIYRQGSDQYGHHQLFTEMVERHCNFHLEAGKIAMLNNAKQSDMAIQRLGSNSQYLRASKDVVKALQALKQAIAEESVSDLQSSS